ncbi:hypothetical protein Naga_100550g2 [Nannochloropsis gaditana]|uniref:Uncharacterized protein n=1 Tax=Nannochloropsis gaditana TaxID=72520 RepID=W7TSV0_9STRA|nr:hypothetical protein Naga_100550g2 [Nannochloropsis gaditana]
MSISFTTFVPSRQQRGDAAVEAVQVMRSHLQWVFEKRRTRKARKTITARSNFKDIKIGVQNILDDKVRSEGEIYHRTTRKGTTNNVHHVTNLPAVLTNPGIITTTASVHLSLVPKLRSSISPFIPYCESEDDKEGAPDIFLLASSHQDMPTKTNAMPVALPTPSNRVLSPLTIPLLDTASIPVSSSLFPPRCVALPRPLQEYHDVITHLDSAARHALILYGELVAVSRDRAQKRDGEVGRDVEDGALGRERKEEEETGWEAGDVLDASEGALQTLTAMYLEGFGHLASAAMTVVGGQEGAVAREAKRRLAAPTVPGGTLLSSPLPPPSSGPLTLMEKASGVDENGTTLVSDPQGLFERPPASPASSLRSDCSTPTGLDLPPPTTDEASGEHLPPPTTEEASEDGMPTRGGERKGGKVTEEDASEVRACGPGRPAPADVDALGMARWPGAENDVALVAGVEDADSVAVMSTGAAEKTLHPQGLDPLLQATLERYSTLLMRLVQNKLEALTARESIGTLAAEERGCGEEERDTVSEVTTL